jgi:hypothetical protein
MKESFHCGASRALKASEVVLVGIQTLVPALMSDARQQVVA